MKKSHFLMFFFVLLVARIMCNGQNSEKITLDPELELMKASVLKNTNPGFEQGLTGWSIYEEAGISRDAIIRVKNDGNAKYGEKYLFMRLPVSATDNQSQYINIGQHLELDKSKRYRFGVNVKWANPQNALPSAIISIWAKNPDNSFNGKDVWVNDGNDYKYLSFEFTPNASGNVFCYLSLLTHQDGYDNTDIYVDAFRIEEIGDAIIDNDTRAGNSNLLLNSYFNNSFNGWDILYNNPHNVDGLNRYIFNDNGNYRMRLELPGSADSDYLNNTWIGVSQDLVMYAGNEYQIEANIDRIVPDAAQYPTIVNIYAYKPGTSMSDPVWLGSVDYKFNKPELHCYSQRVTPAETATYKIVVRVFGWGNEGNPLKLNIDNVKVKRIE